MLSTRIFIIDHHQDFLNTIVKMLRRDFTIVGALTDGAIGLAFALALNPDILILDISLPDINGVEVAKRLAAAQCRAKVIFLSHEEKPAHRQRDSRLRRIRLCFQVTHYSRPHHGHSCGIERCCVLANSHDPKKHDSCVMARGIHASGVAGFARSGVCSADLVPSEFAMVSKVMDALFGCIHANYSFPRTLKPVRSSQGIQGKLRTYVVCLDCARMCPTIGTI